MIWRWASVRVIGFSTNEKARTWRALVGRVRLYRGHTLFGVDDGLDVGHGYIHAGNPCQHADGEEEAQF